MNKSIKNGKKEIDKVANSLVFKSIPNNQNCSYLSEKKKSNENRYDQFFTLDKKEGWVFFYKDKYYKK